MYEDIKKLGFGLMRLPRKDGGFDIELIKQMVDRFMSAGFKYFDTAWAYTGSEEAIKEALVDRYPRDSFYLATKCAAFLGEKTEEAAKAQFETSLNRSGAGYFDFYLLHNLGESRTAIYDEYGLWDYFAEKKAQGLIKNLGFSFHSTADQLDDILTKHPEVDFVQLQINYLDWDANDIQSRQNYEIARKHGKPIVIMEPVKGGLLADPPQPVKDVFNAKGTDLSYASRAIRFAMSLPGVLTVLSGMNSMQQLEDNITAAEDTATLSNADAALYEDARRAFASIPMIGCTSCNYCAKVCPMEIQISGIFTAMNVLARFGNLTAASREYNRMSHSGTTFGSDCIKCGACEDACPQSLPIRDLLEQSVEKIENSWKASRA